MTTTDKVLRIVIDSPYGSGSYGMHPASTLIYEIEEIYGMTAGDSNESIARQWCELRGYGFVRYEVVGPVTFKDLIGGQVFMVNGGKYLKLGNPARLASGLWINSIRLDGGGLHYTDPRVEVQRVELN